jgi:hypothetical protein
MDEEQRQLGFMEYKPDCSLVQCYRIADWRLASSTQFDPVFDGKCDASFSRYCSHCGCYHNFIAKPSALAHVCNMHNRRHESKEDLENVLAEAEHAYIQRIEAARAATADPSYDPDKALVKFLHWYHNVRIKGKDEV